MKKSKQGGQTKDSVEQMVLSDDEITRAKMPNMSRGKSDQDNYK